MTALVERVTVPLVPRTSAECCDLAVAFVGRHAAETARLYLAVAGPTVAAVYALGRFAGTDVALALVAGLVASKPLGLLTVAATARAVFGEPFERARADGRSVQSRRLADLTRSVVTAAAVLAGAALVGVTLEDAWGVGRLAAFGPGPAAAISLLLAGLLAARAGFFVAERHGPSRSLLSGMTLGTLGRLLLASPLSLLFFDATRAAGAAVAVFWLPVAFAAMLWRSLGAERRAMRDLDPTLHARQADASLRDAAGELAQPAIVIAVASAGLAVVAFAAAEACVKLFGLEGPIGGPLGDYFADAAAFDLGPAARAVHDSPAVAAAVASAGLLAYQLGRIAWFFAYLDARVRRDCWDMELLLAREAKRLEGERREDGR